MVKSATPEVLHVDAFLLHGLLHPLLGAALVPRHLPVRIHGLSARRPRELGDDHLGPAHAHHKIPAARAEAPTQVGDGVEQEVGTVRAGAVEPRGRLAEVPRVEDEDGEEGGRRTGRGVERLVVVEAEVGAEPDERAAASRGGGRAGREGAGEARRGGGQRRDDGGGGGVEAGGTAGGGLRSGGVEADGERGDLSGQVDGGRDGGECGGGGRADVEGEREGCEGEEAGVLTRLRAGVGVGGGGHGWWDARMNGRWNRFDVDEGVRRGVGWSWSWETGGEGNRRAGRAEREGGGEFWSPTNHFRVYQNPDWRRAPTSSGQR